MVKMFAATAAFLVWALAVPAAPTYPRNERARAGFGAIIISTFLSLLEPIFERPASKSSTEWDKLLPDGYLGLN